MQTLVSFIILISLSGVCAAKTTIAAAPTIFKDWKIAFIRGGDIWTAKGDGSNAICVIKNGTSPCWSKNKSKLAFARDGNVWIADADGLHQRQLTHYGTSGQDISKYICISWNSKTDGITFSRPDCYEILKPDNKTVTDIEGMTIYDLWPVSSGKTTASVRFDLFDTGTLFNFPDNDNPSWSSSGNYLAFTRNGDIWLAEYYPEEDGGRAGWDIFRLAATASYDSPTYRASRTNLAVTHISWSPDEKHLAYTLNRIGSSGVAELHILTLKLTETNNRTAVKDDMILNDSRAYSGNEYIEPRFPCFSPDGKWIAFSSAGSTYVTSQDGKKVIKLLSNATRLIW